MISPRRQKVDQIRVQYPCHTSHCIFKFLSGQSLATFFTFFQSLNDLKMKERSFVLLLLFMIFSILTFFEETGAETTEGVTVRTKYGDIRGTVMPAPPILGSAVTKVNTFLGIPFAVPASWRTTIPTSKTSPGLETQSIQSYAVWETLHSRPFLVESFRGAGNEQLNL